MTTRDKHILNFAFCILLLPMCYPVFAQNSNENELERNGPNGRFTFDITSQIGSDHDFTEDKILSIANTIFQDDNEKSGYFYYYPAEYSLNWVQARKNDRYDFNINYGSNGQVTLTAILKPKLSFKDTKIAEKLLKKSIVGKVPEGTKVNELTIMPMAQTPQIDFSNLSQFGVEESSISIRAPSAMTEPILISFTTNRIDDLMNMFFNDIGLFGDVVIFPNGEDMPASIRIPFNLKIDDPKTYGRFELSRRNWRRELWTNDLDYPVILSYLHILREQKDGNFYINSWSLDNKEIPEKASVKFTNMESVPKWLDADFGVQRMWMEYTIKPCRSCDRIIRNDIDEGTESRSTENIEVTILFPLEFTQAELIKMKIRAFQADPNNKVKANLETITIRNDGANFTVGPLYIPSGGSPEFEYQLQVIMSDGTIHKSEQWQKVDGLDVAIGESQINNQISAFKR